MSKQPDENLLFTWDSARSFAATLELSGFSGWRLPSCLEFDMLMNPSAQTAPKLRAGHPFQNVGGKYWSREISSSIRDAYALGADMQFGISEQQFLMREKYRVWPVFQVISERDKWDRCPPENSFTNPDYAERVKTSVERFTEIDPSLIFDRTTGLVMLKDLDDVRKIMDFYKVGAAPSDVTQLLNLPRKSSGRKL